MRVNVVEINEDLRDFTVRQFAREFEAGADVTDAANALRASLPQNFHWAVTETEQQFGGVGQSRTLSQLSAVLDTARDNGVRPEAAFTAYVRAERTVRPALLAALAGAATFGAYLAFLVLILAVVVGVYAIVVLPQFKAMFDMFDMPLPAMTVAMIGSHWILLPMLGLILLAVVFYFLGLDKLKRRLFSLQPIRPLLRWIPGFGSWARRYDTGFWLRHYAIFLDAGLAPDAARTAASRHAGEPPAADHRQPLLASAAQLGRLREELAEQLERDRQSTLEQFERPRNLVVILVRAAIYFIVGMYVIAMYLPIFKLGTII